MVVQWIFIDIRSGLAFQYVDGTPVKNLLQKACGKPAESKPNHRGPKPRSCDRYGLNVGHGLAIRSCERKTRLRKVEDKRAEGMAARDLSTVSIHFKPQNDP